MSFSIRPVMSYQNSWLDQLISKFWVCARPSALVSILETISIEVSMYITTPDPQKIFALNFSQLTQQNNIPKILSYEYLVRIESISSLPSGSVSYKDYKPGHAHTYGQKYSWLPTSYWFKNMCNCFTEILRSVSLNSYGMFHPRGPNFLLSWTRAWKKHSPNNNLLQAC